MLKNTMLLTAVLLLYVAGFGQSKPVKGDVRNEKGDPVPYATVHESGTDNNAVADVQGNFIITTKGGAKLTITAVGYATEMVDAANAGTIILKPSAGQLNEVVIVAYGTQNRTNITGSVATVKSADIENKPFTSIDKSLQGAVAGLQSTSGSGAPGSATDVRIRGIGSIAASASPLYVIDGVIATADNLTTALTVTSNVLSTLNPDDIESITVLKDAAAQSIYGSRAANGVILITTKKGKPGRSHLSFSTEVGESDIAFHPKNKPITTEQYQTLLRESIINAGYATDNAGADALITDPVNGLGIDSNYTQTNTNWLNEVTRKATQQQYNLSISGGNDKTQVYASGGFFKQTGIVLFTDYKRYNGSLSLTHKPNEKSLLTAGFNVGYVSQRTPLNSGYYANPASAPFFLLPWYSPRNADGSLKYNDPQNQFPATGGIGFNPVAIGEFTNERSRQTSFRGYVSGEYEIVSGLKLTSRYSGEFINIQEDQYRSATYGDGVGFGGYGFASYRRVYNYTWSNYFDYRKAVSRAGDMYFDVKLGYEAQALNNYGIFTGGSGLPQNMALQYLASAATPLSAYTNVLEQSTTSLFSLADFNYKDRYVLSASFRRDASSVFGANHRSGSFYSVGATWNATEEAFMRNMKSVNLLKLRTSYGQNGNASGFNYYASQATFGYGASVVDGITTNNNYGGQVGSSLNSVGNNNLTWEKNSIFNIGVDFGFWKNRLFGTVEYYSRNTTNLLLKVPLSQTTGVSTQTRNVGAMTNKGIEITLGGKPVVTKNFSWTITGNFSHNTNRVTELYLGNPVADPAGYQFNYTVGHDIYEFYTREWAGVDPANGNPLWYTDSSKSKTTSDISAVKLSLTGKSAQPKFFGSFTNSFSFKGITLDAQFYYNFGNYVSMAFSRYINSDGEYYGNQGQLTEQLNRWQKAGDITNTPKLVIGGNMGSARGSTRFLYKGDYIRLRNLQLSYSLPADLLRKTPLTNVSVYLRGTNLFTFATDKNIPVDPETGIVSTSNMEIFIPKTMTAGVRIGL